MDRWHLAMERTGVYVYNLYREKSINNKRQYLFSYIGKQCQKSH